MKKILFLLLAIWLAAPVSMRAQSWTLVSSTGIGSAGRACAWADDGVTTTLWVARGASLVTLVTTAGAATTIATGTNSAGMGLNPSDGRMWYTTTSGNRLRGRDITPPYAVTEVAGVNGGRHIAYLADGGYILTTASSWQRFNPLHQLVDRDSSAANLSGGFGVAVNEAAEVFWVSDNTQGKVFQFNLATGGLISQTAEPAVTGLCLEAGVLYCTTSTGNVKVVGGATILTGLGTAQDLEFFGDYLGVVTTTAARIYTSTPLPIELVDLSVSPMGKNGAAITARTASEQNNAWMILEQSADGVEFEEVTRQAGGGTTTEEREYRFEVENLAAGLHYWRLRQVDADGTFTFSDLVSLTVKGDEVGVTCFPNPAPAGGEVQVNLTSEDATIEVLDLGGRLLHTEKVAGTSATLQGLPTGLLLVRVTSANRRVTTQKLSVN